jgi:hypothetical protein
MKQIDSVKRLPMHALFIGLVFASAVGVAGAQSTDEKTGAPTTRSQVKMERDDFIKSHTYDPVTENWILKPGFEAPVGMKARADIKADRDEFLRNNHWDVVNEVWVPVKGQPRNLSNLSREQVRMETRQFVRTHRWDEVTSTWVNQPVSRKKK